MTALVLVLLASAARAADYPLPPPPAVSTSTTRVTFSSDKFDYDRNNSVIHLQGHVVVHESTWTLKGDDISIDTQRQSGSSKGPVIVETSTGAVFGVNGQFDFPDHTGTIYDTKAFYGPWSVSGKSAEMLKSRKVDYFTSDFTSCDRVPPHYHLHATELSVVPNKYMFAKNVVFYLGPVPLFYTPFFYKSLEPKGFIPFKVVPGYDRRNGAELNGTATFVESRYTYSRIFTDLYSRQGLGLGGELDHKHGSDSRATLFGYNIDETSTHTDRWALYGDQYQTLGSTRAAMQSRLELQSDANFNNDYARARLYPVQPQLVNSSAFTYKFSQSQLRGAYALNEAAANSPTKYLKQTEDYPRIDYQTNPLKVLKLPWLNTFTGFADNNYTVGRPFIQQSAGGNWEATQSIPIWRGHISDTPKFDYGYTFYDRYDELYSNIFTTATFLDPFIGRAAAQNDVRFRTRIGDIDAIYAYALRQQADGFSVDKGAADRGVETNLATLSDAYRPSRSILTRFTGGYNFQQLTGDPMGFRDRVQPIVGQVYYTPNSHVDVLLNDSYSLNNGNQSYLTDVTVGDIQSTYSSFQTGYNASGANGFSISNNRYFLGYEFGWAPSTGTWHVTGALRSNFASSSGINRVYGYTLFDKEVGVLKIWHDFLTRVMVRFRSGGVREVTFRIDMKLPGKEATQTTAPHRDWESEWYPERATGTVDTPRQ